MTRSMITADHIIAFQNGEHRHLQDGVVMWEENNIIHVGKSFTGTVDLTIDGSGMIVTPGFINTHSHLTDSPLDKSFVEDCGSRQFYNSGLFEYLPARSAAMSPGDAITCARYSMAELLRTGTTTVVEIGAHGHEVIAAAADAGMRLYVGQGFRSGRWYTNDGLSVQYEWDEAAGLRGLDAAIAFIGEIDGQQNDRVRGYLTPSQIDTCTPELLIRSRDAAREMAVPLALHTSQSINEFQEMTRRHGRSPIEFLSGLNFLAPNVILGHAIILAGGTWANYAGDDLTILAASGANVAHCPWVFARRGIVMESFARYLDAGVKMTLGTDTCPQSMIEALRWAAIASKIVDRRTEIARASDVFNAATIGGAAALGRHDLGRIAPGAKADLLLWDAATLTMSPLRDPVRNIVYSAQANDLTSVVIDGDFQMRDGKLLGLDERQLAADLQLAGERMWANMGAGDWAGRSIDELSPQSFPAWV